MTSESAPRPEPRPSPRRLFFGVLFLALGVLLLAANLGVPVPIRLWEAWPFAVLALGAVKLLWGADREERESGFWIVTAGLYCWISAWGLLGLSWGTAWPLFLLAQGIAIVAKGARSRTAAGTSGVDDAR
jgi:hypothetical protein